MECGYRYYPDKVAKMSTAAEVMNRDVWT